MILVANKAEGRAAEAGLIEAWELGLGEPVALSAEHGIGMDDLLRALEPVAAEFPDAAEVVEVAEEIDDSVDEEGEGAALPPGRPIQIAVVGRPNAGKSTLVNAILGEERLLTGPEAGITRDAIAVQVGLAGHAVPRSSTPPACARRRRCRRSSRSSSVSDGLRAVKFAEVVVVLLDVQIPFESQDLRHRRSRRARGAGGGGRGQQVGPRGRRSRRSSTSCARRSGGCCRSSAARRW